MKFYRTIIINKLNNYDWSDEQIERVKQYLLYGTLPNYKTKRFIEKYKDFEVKENKIFFKPLNLEVIPNDKKQQTLKNFYDDFKAIGNGKVAFYKKISSHYINIKRSECSDFLSKQSTYQINTEIKHITNKPILASACGERLAVDLISMDNLSEHNNNFNYILTAIDYFSRKVWAKPLINKTSDNVRDGLQLIFNDMTIKPHLLQSDNGREFKNYDSIAWLKENNIKPVFSLPYSPESNGLIENFNKQLRKMIKEIFIRTNNLNWVDYLQIMVDNKNETFNSTIKAKPNDIWNKDSFYDNVKTKTRELPVSLTKNSLDPEALRIQTKENIKKQAKRQLERTHIEELNIGDHVRVKMSALYSELRKAIKQGNKKLINVSFTPEIYRVFKVIHETHPSYERKRYTLKN